MTTHLKFIAACKTTCDADRQIDHYVCPDALKRQRVGRMPQCADELWHAHEETQPRADGSKTKQPQPDRPFAWAYPHSHTVSKQAEIHM